MRTHTNLLWCSNMSRYTCLLTPEVTSPISIVAKHIDSKRLNAFVKKPSITVDSISCRTTLYATTSIIYLATPRIMYVYLHTYLSKIQPICISNDTISMYKTNILNFFQPTHSKSLRHVWVDGSSSTPSTPPLHAIVCWHWPLDRHTP